MKEDYDAMDLTKYGGDIDLMDYSLDAGGEKRVPDYQNVDR